MKGKDRNKTKEQLIGELERARQQIAELQAHESAYVAERRQIEDECEWLMTEVEAHRRQVTELIRTLELERDTFQTIMENTRTCLAYLDPHFNYLKVNTAYVAGSARSAEELVGRNHFDLFPNAENLAIFEQVRDSGEPVSFYARPFQFASTLPHASAYWDWSLVPVKDSAGTVEGLVLSLLDVTEREHLLEQLESERARLRAIIENAPEGIVVVDADLRILLANPAAGRVYGRHIPYGQDVGSQERLDLTYPDGAPYDLRDLPLTRAALEGTVQTDLEVSIRWPGGQKRSLLVNAAPIRDRRGRIGGAMAVFQDITQRKIMEEALRRRNRDLDRLSRISQALTAVLNLPQVIAQLMEAMADIVGAEGSSVWLWADQYRSRLVCRSLFHNGQHLPFDDLELLAGEGLAGWVAESGESVALADVTVDPRFRNRIDTRTPYHTHSILVVPLRVHDSVVGVLQAINKRDGEFDRSDISLAETLAGTGAIAIENARLVEALHQRTVELRVRNEELNAFAQTVAHDLKQPLAAMLGFADFLVDDEVDMPVAEMKRHVSKIGRIGHKMLDIVDSLLLLAEVRERDVERTPIDMGAVVDEARQRLVPLIDETGAEIIVPARSEWPVAMGSAPWLEEVWANYLSNACKYGGKPPRIELGATVEPGNRIRFWVRDYGPGLTAEEQKRLFTPHTRLGNSRAGGHGLGLSIVRRIVEKLSGEVAVESAGVPGQGSTFSFTLPAAADGKERST